MADVWRPLTWLIAVACAWAFLLLLAVAAGVGNQFPASENSAVPMLSIPALVQPHERLGPLANYLEVASRPLLMPDRRPGVEPAGNGPSGAADMDVSLTSVLMTPTLQMVILTGNQDGRSRRVRLGDTAEGSNWRLIRLEPRRAVFDRPSGEITLELRLYDGKNAGAVPPPDANVSGAVNPAPASVVNAAPANAAATPQDQQVEAIRRRIEERRAQMHAEAAPADSDVK